MEDVGGSWQRRAPDDVEMGSLRAPPAPTTQSPAPSRSSGDLPPYSAYPDANPGKRKGGKTNDGFVDEGIGSLAPCRNSNASSLDKPRISDDDGESRGDDEDDDDDDDKLELELSGCMKYVARIQTAISKFTKDHKQTIKTFVLIVALLLFIAYFITAIVKNESTPYRLSFLIVATLAVISFLIWDYFAPKVEEKLSEGFCEGIASTKVKTIVKVAMALVFAVFLLVVLFYWVDVATHWENLISGIGILLFILIFFITSHSPSHVQWRTVISGIMIQFVIGVIILKTKPGFCFFRFLGNQVQIFLEYTKTGVAFVFALEPFNFAFQVLSIIIFFSSFVAMLYHAGLMLYVIKKVAWVMGKVMGTTAGESLVATANIFIGQSEAPLLIRPFLPIMTNSELHSVMTSGFATVAGSVMGAYISFGAKASHLICASIMSAPAALAMAKLSYPETKKSKTKFKDISNLETKSPYGNVLEAFSSGAMDAISLAAGIAANLIAFLALVAFVDACLTYFGGLVEIESVLCDKLTLRVIMSYIFIPLAWMLGVEWADCKEVSELIGIKTVVNEFVAYKSLGDLIKTRDQNVELLERFDGNYTLSSIKEIRSQLGCFNGTSFPSVMIEGQMFESRFISYRSEVIATYALCGFSNLSSMGILLGALTAMAPNRKSDLSRIVVRAMIAGNVACFMTACISGLLYDPNFEQDSRNDCDVSWL